MWPIAMDSRSRLTTSWIELPYSSGGRLIVAKRGIQNLAKLILSLPGEDEHEASSPALATALSCVRRSYRNDLFAIDDLHTSLRL